MEIRTHDSFKGMVPLWAVGFYDDLRPHVTGNFGMGAVLYATEAEAVAYKEGTVYTMLDFYVRTEGDRNSLIASQKAAQDNHAASLRGNKE